MKTPENDWASTHRAMEECLLERQRFIEKLLVDIRKTEDENRNMLEALDTLAIYAEAIMERVKHNNMSELTTIYAASMPDLEVAVKQAKLAISKGRS